MTEPQERVNPFAREDNPFAPAPPLKCPHDDSDYHVNGDCHVDVAGTGRLFKSFQSQFDALKEFKANGLFVAVSGASLSGKTSLINRCIAYAQRSLCDLGAKCAFLDVSDKFPDLDMEGRVAMVGGEVDRFSQEATHAFGDYETPFSPPFPADGQGTSDDPPNRPVLETYTLAASRSLLAKGRLIMRVAPTDLKAELNKYWASTHKKMVVFSETTLTELPKFSHNSIGERRSCVLPIGRLQREEIKTFLRARTDTAGRGVSFPDLDIDETMVFFENIIKATEIGTVQTNLYNVYQYYLYNPWPANGIIKLADLVRISTKFPEGLEG